MITLRGSLSTSRLQPRQVQLLYAFTRANLNFSRFRFEALLLLFLSAPSTYTVQTHAFRLDSVLLFASLDSKQIHTLENVTLLNVVATLALIIENAQFDMNSASRVKLVSSLIFGLH